MIIIDDDGWLPQDEDEEDMKSESFTLDNSEGHWNESPSDIDWSYGCE